MSRPSVTVVMPFSGDSAAARLALGALASLDAGPGDELILVDNSPSVPPLDPASVPRSIRLVPAAGERSPAHARNSGAARASGDWLLFIDADCVPRPGLLDAFFAEPIAAEVGAVAGEVVARQAAGGIASRYGATRSFLGQEAHLSHPYRPRASAANLLVRRESFAQLGGFFEGVLAGEDTDFSWRLQEAGWKLELRPEAWASHIYRPRLRELRHQWRGYAAGRAWLARRYDGFHPEPALARAARRRPRRSGRVSSGGVRRGGIRARLERGLFLAIDALLAVEELVGFALSNRPAPGPEAHPEPSVVLLADRYPARDDPLVELAGALEAVRVEAVARPNAIEPGERTRVAIDYLEDDGAAARLGSALWLIARHPLRTALDLALRGHAGDQPPLRALAPAVRRLERDKAARALTMGDRGRRTVQGRIARLAGRPLGQAPSRTRHAPAGRWRRGWR